MAIDVEFQENDEIDIIIEDAEEKTEESTETPETSLKDGEAEEDKVAVETKETETAEPDKVETEDDPTYKDKSREDIISMHREAEKKIGLQGKELGEKRTTEKKETEKNLVDEMSVDDLKEANRKLHVQKAKLDPEYDKDEYEKIANAIAQTEEDILDKRYTSMLSEQMSSKANTEFIEKQKEPLKGKGFFLDDKGEFLEDEYSAVAEQAKGYAEDGKLTENSFYKAMIDLHGIEKVSKILEVNAEQATRSKIKTAVESVDNKVDSKGTSTDTTNRKVVKYSNMTPFEREKYLDGLSQDELKQLREAVNRKKK